MSFNWLEKKGRFNILDFGVDENLKKALDITTQMAFAAGFGRKAGKPWFLGGQHHADGAVGASSSPWRLISPPPCVFAPPCCGHIWGPSAGAAPPSATRAHKTHPRRRLCVPRPTPAPSLCVWAANSSGVVSSKVVENLPDFKDTKPIIRKRQVHYRARCGGQSPHRPLRFKVGHALSLSTFAFITCFVTYMTTTPQPSTTCRMCGPWHRVRLRTCIVALQEINSTGISQPA